MQGAVSLLLLAVAHADPLTTGTVARNAFNLKRASSVEAEYKPKLKMKVQYKPKHEVAEQEVEVWYVNQGSRTDRKDCIERQLTDMGIVPNRFEALEITSDDLKEGGKYEDCVKGGLEKNSVYIDATAGGISKGHKTKMGIIGDTCSHKRLFQQLAESNSTAKYFVVLEDDAIMNPLKFKSAINEFVDTQWGYKGPFAKDWQMVQLDFIGSSCKDHVVGRAGGKRVFKPKDIAKPGGMSTCSRYFGSHALLMQKDQLTSVVDHMESHKTIPMDWVQGSLPRALSWRPQIARSPTQKFNKLPEFCSKNVHKSSISSNFKVKESEQPAVKLMKAASKGQLDMNAWVDAFKTETQEDQSDEADEE